LLRGGRLDAGASMFARILPKAPNTTPEAMMAAEGELALQRGKLNEAAGMLETAMKTMNARFPEYLLAAQSLARVYDRQGKTDEAIAALQDATKEARACGGFLRAAFWPHLRFDLMELYRKTGRHNEAEVIRQELIRLVSLSDDEFVLKAKLSGTRPE